MFYHVGRQLIQHQLVIIAKKLFTVKQQTFHEFAIYEDASVLSEFGPRQLLDESIKHRAFRKLEGISIVDERVATIIEFHFGSSDSHLVKTDVSHLLQVDIAQIAMGLAAIEIIKRQLFVISFISI